MSKNKTVYATKDFGKFISFSKPYEIIKQSFGCYEIIDNLGNRNFISSSRFSSKQPSKTFIDEKGVVGNVIESVNDGFIEVKKLPKFKEDFLNVVSEGKKNDYENCLEFARKFILNMKQGFTSEDMIEAYKESFKIHPEEPRVWGAVVRKLSSEGLIKFVEYVRYQKKEGHGKPSALWINKNYYACKD